MTETTPGTLDELPTPCLVLDRERLMANLDRVRERARALDVDLRPHVKTAKTVPVAQQATRGASGAITVSTLAEAEHFLEAGFEDMVYAVGIAPGKLDRVAALREGGAALKLLLDTPAQARAVAAAGQRHGDTLPALVEVDCDGTRGGVDPEGERLLEIAHALGTGDGAELAGVLTHAGSAYSADGEDELLAAAQRERDAVVTAATRLREAGHAVPIVSVGSTPTALAAEDLTGVTEMRPGNYVFFDLYQAGLGVCEISDIAVSVLATVIGHRDTDGAPIVDAGALAVSKDRSTARFDDQRDVAYGLVCDPATCEPLADGHILLTEPSQEHGVIVRRDGTAPELEIGDTVRVLPNHSCITAAGHERYHVVDDGQIVDVWARVNGW